MTFVVSSAAACAFPYVSLTRSARFSANSRTTFSCIDLISSWWVLLFRTISRPRPAWPKPGGASLAAALLAGERWASLPHRLGPAARGGGRVADPQLIPLQGDRAFGL